MKYIASVSFGKDSLAMLLKILENPQKYPLDEIVFYDTGMEFKAIYNIRDKVKQMVESLGIKYIELKPKCSFCYLMTEKVVNKGKPNEHKGYAWCGGRCRWGTTEKLKELDKYCKEDVVYLGIASDEPERLKKERKGNKVFPLAELEMTEKDCLQFCYDKGFDWIENGVELYSILNRVSCWCCANKNLKELKNYYLYLTEYWQKLKNLQLMICRPFKYNKYTIFDLEEKFKKERI